MYQLVNGKRVTNRNALPRDILRIWDTFRSDTRNNNNTIYNKAIASGISRCLAEACIELSTSHQSNLV